MVDPTIKPGAAIFQGILTVIHGGLFSLNGLATAVKQYGGVCFCATLMIVCGGLLSLNEWAISVKPGGGVHFWETELPCCIFLHWLKIFGAPWLWLETTLTIKGMMGPLVHSLLLANEKEPQEWALLFQLWLLSHMTSGSSGARTLDGVTCTQHGCFASSNTSASVKVVKGDILSSI